MKNVSATIRKHKRSIMETNVSGREVLRTLGIVLVGSLLFTAVSSMFEPAYWPQFVWLSVISVLVVVFAVLLVRQISLARRVAYLEYQLAQVVKSADKPSKSRKRAVDIDQLFDKSHTTH